MSGSIRVPKSAARRLATAARLCGEEQARVQAAADYAGIAECAAGGIGVDDEFGRGRRSSSAAIHNSVPRSLGNGSQPISVKACPRSSGTRAQ